MSPHAVFLASNTIIAHRLLLNPVVTYSGARRGRVRQDNRKDRKVRSEDPKQVT